MSTDNGAGLAVRFGLCNALGLRDCFGLGCVLTAPAPTVPSLGELLGDMPRVLLGDVDASVLL